MKCPNCKQEVPDEARVCGYCGTKLIKEVKERHCPNCGKEVPAKAKVCGYCGQRLTPPKKIKVRKVVEKPLVKQPKTVVKPPHEDILSKVKKLPIWVWGIAVIAIVALSVVLLIPKPGKGESLELLEGTWKGELENKMDGSSFEITFVFPDDCELNRYCGHIYIPEFSLTTDVMITAVSGVQYEFFVSVNEDKPKDELPDEYLEYINANQLELYSKGPTGYYSQGMLYKQ